MRRTILSSLAAAALLSVMASEPATSRPPGEAANVLPKQPAKSSERMSVAQLEQQRFQQSPSDSGPAGPKLSDFKAIVLPPVSGEGAAQMAAVDKLVKDYLIANNLPGATVAVSKDRRLVWSKGYGYANFADKTPMQPWHRTFFGSVSKVITTLAAMALVEDGALDVDALVYGKASPLWGSNPDDPPGVVFTPGVLADPGAYFNAMIHGALALPPPDVETALEWSSKIKVKHLLSHTSGLRNSGDGTKAAKHFDKAKENLTYSELHLAMLMGLAGPTLLLEPGTSRKYSNHGFGLAGHIIAERSGMSYADFVRERVLLPLGLNDVVPAYTSVGELDAFRHTPDNKPIPHEELDLPTLGLAAGGWAATAQDLVRILCATDKQTALPILRAATIDLMEADAVPGIPNRPLGWDSRDVTFGLNKDGLLRGGRALILKFPPGFNSGGIDLSDINVSIGINVRHEPKPTALLVSIAKAAAQAAIPEHYDLFDPAFRCAKKPLGLVATPPGTPPPSSGVIVTPPPGSLPPPRLVCAGGAVRGGECFCPRALRKVAVGPHAWRCQRSQVETGPVTPTLRTDAPAGRLVAPTARPTPTIRPAAP